MKESVVHLDALTVVANTDKRTPLNDMATISAQQITVESASRIAAGINDPGRTAQSFAGVASADDENNELVIRGNSPRGVLWRLEGVPIPNPNHFSNGEGGSGGGVSALSTLVSAIPLRKTLPSGSMPVTAKAKPKSTGSGSWVLPIITS